MNTKEGESDPCKFVRLTLNRFERHVDWNIFEDIFRRRNKTAGLIPGNPKEEGTGGVRVISN